MRHLLIIVGAGLITAGITLAATPPTKPESPATSTTPASTSRPAAQVDALLRGFPASAVNIIGRADAKNLTIEGRVREIHDASTTGTSETRIVLVGRSQPDEVPTHFTCHLAKMPEDPLLDQIIRITGSVGPYAATGDRIDLLNCKDVKVIGPPTVGNQLAGTWRCDGVMLDGAALHKDALAARKPADIPEVTFVSPMRMDLVFKPDNTLLAELWTDATRTTLSKRVGGKWLITKDDESQARIRLDLSATPTVETTVEFVGNRLKLTLPGFNEKRLAPDMLFEKPVGTPLTVDWKALKNQTLSWLSANNTINPDSVQAFISSTSASLDQCQVRNSWYITTIGSAVTKRGKTTTLVAAYGKLSVLEFNDAQTLHNAVSKNMQSSGSIPGWGKMMLPEVKVEGFVMDKKGAVSPAEPLTGKVTLRALRRMPPGQYVLMLGCQNTLLFNFFDHAPGADGETFPFQFAPLATHLAGNTTPVPVIFLIGRQPNPTVMLKSEETCVISDPIITLMDIAGR